MRNAGALMKYRRKLFAAKTMSGRDCPGLLAAAVKENVAYHRAHNPAYRRLLDGMGFDAAHFDRFSQLPFLTTAFLKGQDLNTKRSFYMAQSSGTSGKKSAVSYAPDDLPVLLKTAVHAMARRGLFSAKPVNYVMLGYRYHRGNQAQTMRTAYLGTLMAPALRKRFALEWRDGAYQPRLEGLLEDLVKFSRSSFPCRILGFPSYLFFLLERMEERQIRLTMPAGSKILLGGGWKQFTQEEVEKAELYRLVRERLGIEEEDIVEIFAAVEHPVIYCDCPRHHFHVPAFARIVIRDVHSLKPLPMGEPGLIHFVSPILKGSPVVSIMTDDIGVLHPGSACGCGDPAPFFTVLGRAGLSEIKTCVQGANEYAEGQL